MCVIDPFQLEIVLDCQEIEDRGLVRAFLNDDLTEVERGGFQGHVSACGGCRESLRLGAALMLQPALPDHLENEASQGVRGLMHWLFPQGMSFWQPALAFAAVLLVAIPLLQTVGPASSDGVGAGDPVWREGGTSTKAVKLSEQMATARRAIQAKQPEQAVVVLATDRLNWDEGRPAELSVAFQLRGRAFMLMAMKFRF